MNKVFKNNEPLVTVICTCHNENPLDLHRSINSVLKQKYIKIELIVIDDASNIVFCGLNKNNYKYSKKEIIWKRLSKNVGVATARNIGIKLSQGYYISFLDAGDWWDEDKIWLQVILFEKFKGKNIGIVYCSTLFHYPNGEEKKVENNQSLDYFKELLYRQPISGSISSAMITADVVGNVGYFYDKEDIPEDREYWLRISMKYNVKNVNKICVHIQCGNNGRSASPEIKSITYLRFLNMYQDLIKKHKMWNIAMAHYKLMIGWKFYYSRCYLQTIKNLLFAFLYHPQFIMKGVAKRIKAFLLWF